MVLDAREYHQNMNWGLMRWRGTICQKTPHDLWIYHELIYDIKPKVIVELGTKYGGSAKYLANMLDLNGDGKVITVDIHKRDNVPSHQRITYVIGDSTAPEIVTKVHRLAKTTGPVMVIVDSDHRKTHVLGELNAYHDLVTVGSYLIAEDTNLGVNGPRTAVDRFLKSHKNFKIVRHCERFCGLSFNPEGYMVREK